MEETPQESFLEMHLDYDGGNILQETVRWSRFLSVTGMIGTGLLILVVALAGNAIIALYSRLIPGIESFAWVLLLLLLLILCIAGVLAFMLYRFSTLTRKGIQTQDQALFNKGLRGLKVYFLISGIVAILGLLVNLSTLTSLL